MRSAAGERHRSEEADVPKLGSRCRGQRITIDVDHSRCRRRSADGHCTVRAAIHTVEVPINAVSRARRQYSGVRRRALAVEVHVPQTIEEGLVLDDRTAHCTRALVDVDPRRLDALRLSAVVLPGVWIERSILDI